MSAIKLSDLLRSLYDTTIYNDQLITGLSLDSRSTRPGDLFFAYKGTKADGRHFIDEAIKNGAVAVLAEIEQNTPPIYKKQTVPIFPIDHLNQRLPEIAAKFYHFPSKKLQILGVTGTNGKTSCTHFIGQVLQHLRIPVGIVGTLGNGLYGHIEPSSLTTPNAIELQALLADFVKHKVKIAAMEVSSHSIDQQRIKGIEFEVGIFTNLTRDHLDYHQSMEAYGATKRKLLESTLSKHAVININDAFGKIMLDSLERQDLFAYSVGKEASIHSSIPYIYAEKIQLDFAGIRAHVVTPWGESDLILPLLGQFNLSNALAVLTTLCILGFSFFDIIEGFTHLSPVSGRMQCFGGKEQPLIVVDYAHTPDALEKVLAALRSHCQGRLFCLFGCGGDRDKGKRPLMAKIAEQHADLVVVTDDNPRTENSTEIVRDILKGFTHPDKIIIQHDRSKAIQDIIQYAKKGDCVLIAGKGAEQYQIVGNEKIPFSDVEKVMENLK